jgi:RNA polymerase sigma-70 factor (ECF subfamily)
MALMLLRKQHFTFVEPLEHAEETTDLPELNILREERNHQLYEALSRLSAEYRQILILLYFEDMSHEEAGRIMGKNRKQIYNLVERGRAALREQLERMGFDDAQYG